MLPEASGGETAYRHPLGWYTLQRPADWRLLPANRPGDLLQLAAPDGDAVASVSVSRSSGLAFPPASLDLLRRSLPGMCVLSESAVEGARDGMQYARRDELLGRKQPWWCFWRRSEPVSWLTTACFTRGTLMAVVAVHLEPHRAMRHRPAVESLLASLRLAANPAPSPEEFIARLVELARLRYPARRIAAGEEGLTLVVDGARITLDDAYQAVLDGQRTAPVAYRGLLGAIAVLRPGGQRLEEVEHRLLPVIKPRWWLERVDAQTRAADRLLRLPFPNDTALVFAVDYTAAMRFVTVEEAERWELPPKLMVRVARRNLQALRAELPLRGVLGQRGELRAVLIQAGDGYDAARILLPGLREKLREHLGEDFLVAVPHRDLLLAFTEHEPQVREQLVEYVRQQARSRPHPITDRLFRLSAAWVTAAEV
ncbi:MAG: hypothetical protein KatS3mg102_2501 [Planctomycetota bacterium]|nr:MAG: hypothetical protein KatS3mg102_2501 [Planctomycetota bacterium]